jgi:hypothetical protein
MIPAHMVRSGSAAAHDDPFKHRAAVAVAAREAVFPVECVAAGVVGHPGAAAASFGGDGGENSETQYGSDGESELFHDVRCVLCLLLCCGPAGRLLRCPLVPLRSDGTPPLLFTALRNIFRSPSHIPRKDRVLHILLPPTAVRPRGHEPNAPPGIYPVAMPRVTVTNAQTSV